MPSACHTCDRRALGGTDSSGGSFGGPCHGGIWAHPAATNAMAVPTARRMTRQDQDSVSKADVMDRPFRQLWTHCEHQSTKQSVPLLRSGKRQYGKQRSKPQADNSTFQLWRIHIGNFGICRRNCTVRHAVGHMWNDDHVAGLLAAVKR